MKKISNKYIDNLVQRVINETLEEKADSLVSKIKSNVNELGGMDDGHPRFGKLNLSKMSDDEIEALMKQPVGHDDEDEDFEGQNDILDYEDHVMNKTLEDGNDEYDEFEDEELWNDEMDEEDCMECGKSNMYESSEVCECGGGIYEGECVECGKTYMDEDIYDEDDLDDDNEFDYVAEEDDTIEFEDDETEKQEENKEACDYHKKKINSGDLTPEEEQDFKERYNKMGCKSAVKDLARRPISMNERLRGNQSRIDKNKNGKIDAEDFKILRGKKHESEIDEKLYGKQTKLDKNKNGKIDAEDFKMLRKESVKLTESEIIDLIEKIVLEQKEENKTKSNIKTTEKPKGLAAYEKAVRGSKKENDDYIKSVAKKMKDYLKDGSKGEYEENPKHFPKGNGELAKMSKKAYIPSDAVKDFTDNLTAAGQENLMFDEIHPNEDWVTDNIEGSSRTGNNPEWANTGESDVNKKRNEIRKKNLLGKIKQKAYNKAPQPIVSDKSGEDEGDKLMTKLESVNPKESKKLNEEFEKMKSLISYDRKTQ